MATKIIAKEAFTYRNASTSELLSVGYGQIREVDDSLAADLISDGLAELYTLITPTGTKTITENGENIDVAQYSKATVAVPNPSTGKVTITGTAEVDVTNYASAQVVDANLVAENIKKDVTILGVTGSYEAQ